MLKVAQKLSQTRTFEFLTITLIMFELRVREAVNMVVPLYVSHSCCPSFYGYSLKTQKTLRTKWL